ncbi:MAG: hypothetical protein ABSH47_02510 [Bryobacteraceae bacterium]
MLNEFQTKRVWENMLAAEARSLYFADLASRYTRHKQWITGASFFLASGAAASLVGKLPQSVPLVLSGVVALTSAYSMAVGLDRKVGTMAKLHSAWSQIAVEYDRLWNHTDDPDAEAQLDRIIRQEKEPSELASTEAPNDQKLLGKWQDHVFSMYRPTEQHG